MRECPQCHRDFPAHLIQPLIDENGARDMCGICALRIRNKAYGYPKKTPFQGEIAKLMYEEAKKFLRRN